MSVRYVKDFTFDPAFGFTGSAAGRHDARNHPSDADDNEFGDGSYVENPPALAKEKARGGRAKSKGYALGGAPDMMPPGGRPTGIPMAAGAPGVAPAAGPMAAAPPPAGPQQSPLAQGGADGGALGRATITMPVHDAARAAHGLMQAGRLAGVRQAIGNSMAARTAAAGHMRALPPGAAGAPAAAPPAPVAQQGVPTMAHGGHITAAQRHRLPSSEFGLPGKEAYPIDTPGRARSALSRASANASTSEQATIRRKVHARYPSIGKK